MKTYYLSILVVITTININAQTVVFSENFSNVATPDVINIYRSLGDVPSGWVQQNIDGQNQYPNNNNLFDEYMNGYGFRVENESGYGKKLITCSSPHISNTFGYTADFVRTPVVSIPVQSLLQTNLEFGIDVISSTFDSLRVYISTNSQFSAQKQLLKTITPITSFSLQTIDISSYNGQSIYIYFLANNKIYNALGASSGKR